MASSQLLSVLLLTTCSLTSSFQQQLPPGRPHHNIGYRPQSQPRPVSVQGVRSRHHKLFAEEGQSSLSSIENYPLQSSDDVLSNADFGSSSQISYFDVEEATAAIKQDLQDRASDFSDKLKSGITMDDTGISEGLKRIQTNLEGAADRIAVETEVIAKTKENLAAYMTDTFSAEGWQRSVDSVNEFGKYYTSSLESRYHISESMQSLTSGKVFDDAIVAAQNTVQALDLKENAPVFLLLVAFFWGSDQRNVGLERGRKMGEERIKRLEIELDSAKAMVREKNTVESEEVKQLRAQMEALQSQVEALTAVTQKVTEELEQARKLSVSKPPVDVQHNEVSITASSHSSSAKAEGDKDISMLEVAEAPPKAGNTKAPSKVKGERSTKATTAKETQAAETPNDESNESMVDEEVAVKDEKPMADDWGRFSRSTLKRKTIKDLVAYLSDRGVECMDENGKPLKKDDLVGLVQSG